MSRVAHDLVVDSVTGVDVSLAVAGTGARALAFLIDLAIRAVLVVAWYVLATVLYNGAFSLSAPLDPESSWYLYVALPAAGLFTLYHCVLEIVMRGRTPGKRMIGVRLVTRNGSAPTLTACLVRNVFRLVDSFPVGYGVGLITSMVTRDQVRVGDLAAGTLLVYENREALGAKHFGRMPKGQKLDAATTDLIGELLDRWHSLDPEARVRLARALIVRATGTVPDDARDENALHNRLEQLA